MKKRTEKDRARNVKYQARLYKKRKLFYAALQFILRLYRHRPPGMQPVQLRHYLVRVAQLFRLPYGWDDQDLQRAYNTLHKLEKEAFTTDYLNYSGDYQVLLTAIMEPLQTYNATTEDRARAVAAAMFAMGMELSSVFGNKKPDIPCALLFALAVGQPPYAKWVPRALVDFILRNFRQNESIQISNMLYEELVKTTSDTTADIFGSVEEDETDEMVVDFSNNANAGHCLS